VVACNLYPFATKPSVELIDIGGPAMVRAAAKNSSRVAVLVEPADYGEVLEELRLKGEIGPETRRRLARAAFAHTAAYDAAIVGWLDATEADKVALPPTLHLTLGREGSLRYGENPHQRAASYRELTGPGVSYPASRESGAFLEEAVQHGGRELSYLNLFDAEAAWALANELVSLPGGGEQVAAVVVKHANCCGAAVAKAGGLAECYRRAVEADPISAFGGIVALTGTVDRPLAEDIVQSPLADVVVARNFDGDAVALMGDRRRNTRLLSAPVPRPPAISLRQVDGGWLVQEPDRLAARPEDWRLVTKASPTSAQLEDAALAWAVCARTSSNAIVLAKGGGVVGVGCGQQTRVDAARLAVAKAKGRAAAGAAASDAFFPFPDGLETLAEAGVSVVVQPGGSLRDEELVKVADERGIAMLLTSERHFRH
jgi:phosphoribosylaminoimidazolecarboxamide formyltransferase/IMP cyclohydrolase